MDMQNNVNAFNQESTIYQSSIQAELSRYSTQVEVALNQTKIDLQAAIDSDSKTQVLEIEKASKQMETIIQDNTAKLSKYSQELAQYNADVNQVNSDNQSKLSQFSQNIANYNAKLQKDSLQYKWLQDRMMYLKQRYNELFGIRQNVPQEQ